MPKNKSNGETYERGTLTASVKEMMDEANEKGYLGTVPDETPNNVYAMPNPGEGAPNPGEGAPEDINREPEEEA